RVQAPAPGEHSADEGVVDPELAALAGDPILGGRAAGIEALRVVGMDADEHGPPDVVQNRSEGELVAVGGAGDLGDPVRRTLDGEGVHPKALGGRTGAVQLE